MRNKTKNRKIDVNKVYAQQAHYLIQTTIEDLLQIKKAMTTATCFIDVDMWFEKLNDASRKIETAKERAKPLWDEAFKKGYKKWKVSNL